MDHRYAKLNMDIYNESYYSEPQNISINFKDNSLNQNQYTPFGDVNEIYDEVNGIPFNSSSYNGIPDAYINTQTDNSEIINHFLNQDFSHSPGLVTDDHVKSNRYYNFHIHKGVDLDDDSADSSKSKKRKTTSSIQSTKILSKKSILEDILELLDEERFGVKWIPKIDTEGDEQDGILIYDEGLLERTLQERRNVKSYGLSKHLSKDLRYYGFMYDKDQKIFWNEDNKDLITRKSYWQKNDRSLYGQLKRITSESERNLSRLLTLVDNVEMAEILKNPDIATKVCPPPNKYINLNEISSIINDIDVKDVNNITLLLSRDTNSNVVTNLISKGLAPTADFDRLLSRMGGSISSFLENFREFVKEAKEWYHGFMESDEATEHLKDKMGGTFLIRESARSNCYSLSWVTSSEDINYPKVNHMRIMQTNSGYKVNTDLEPSRTLPLWIKNHSNYLKYPCPSAKFANLIIQDQPVKSEGEIENQYLPKDYVLGFPDF